MNRVNEQSLLQDVPPQDEDPQRVKPTDGRSWQGALFIYSSVDISSKM